MTDVHNKATRRYNMSQIKGKNTKPEMLVRKYIFSKGFRYKLHDKKLPGKPDIVFPKIRTVIFVHGCFWHGHENCKYFVVPKTNTEWWLSKINRNKQNDVENISKLKNEGWDIFTIFECELKNEKLNKTLNNILVQLNNKLSENKDE